MRFVTWNLLYGGIDDGDPTRMHHQLTWVKDTFAPDFLYGQELKGWLKPSRDGSTPWQDAEDILGMRGYLTQGSPYDSELGIFIRPGAARVIRPRHVPGGPYTAGQCVLEVEINGVRMRLVNVHLHPTSKTLRQADTETLQLHYEKGKKAVIAGDFNCAAINDDPPERYYPAGTDDPTPARILQQAGMRDTGLELGDTTPTCRDPFAYRADRICHNIDGAKVTRHEVHWAPKKARSDHGLNLADIEFAEPAAGARAQR